MTRRAITFDASPTRTAGLAMIAIAAAWPFLPAGVGISCPLRSLTGVPCPFCGMTTSVVNTVQGDIVTAVQANPFGPVLLGFVLLVVARRRREWRVALSVLIPVVIASWIFQLNRFGWL